jgi:hypothetical protein
MGGYTPRTRNECRPGWFPGQLLNSLGRDKIRVSRRGSEETYLDEIYTYVHTLQRAELGIRMAEEVPLRKSQ